MCEHSVSCSDTQQLLTCTSIIVVVVAAAAAHLCNDNNHRSDAEMIVVAARGQQPFLEQRNSIDERAVQIQCVCVKLTPLQKCARPHSVATSNDWPDIIIIIGARACELFLPLHYTVGGRRRCCFRLAPRCATASLCAARQKPIFAGCRMSARARNLQFARASVALSPSSSSSPPLTGHAHSLRLHF